MKKKLKIKKTAYLIIIIILLIVLLILNPTKNNKNQSNGNQSTSKEETFISNIKKIDYYNNEYLERYIKYQENNPSMDSKQIIKNVNMNLDQKKYEYTIKAKNLNTNKILVNKYYYLDENYVPNNLEEIDKEYSKGGIKLVKEAKEAFQELSKKARESNLNIIAMSAYRSYQYQVTLYNNYVKQDGKEEADAYSARPGHSEHQTGLATDVYNQKETYTNFEKTEEFKWMQENAYKFGFILRFPKGKEEETGYQYESWHYRYVGKEAAKYIKENNITFEEYYATKIKD